VHNRICLLIVLAVFCTGSLFISRTQANTSTGFQGTSGIELVATDKIRMASEDLYLSPTEVRVAYLFHNVTGQAVETLVAFPLPTIDLSLGTTAPNWHFPVNDTNFLRFTLEIEGQKLTPSLERRAFFKGQDVTKRLEQAGALTIAPWKTDEKGYERQIAKLQPAILASLRKDGLLAEGEDPDTPQWQLQTRYYWQQTFPPNVEIKVNIAYKPFVGKALGGKTYADIDPNLAGGGRLVGESTPPKSNPYCLDNQTVQGLKKALKRGVWMDLIELEYILSTGSNWLGPIGRFHLTIDKASPDNILSLCWNNLQKTGPTRFESTLMDFKPTDEIRLLIYSAGKSEQ